MLDAALFVFALFWPMIFALIAWSLEEAAIKRWRFSLATLLTATTLIAVLLGIIVVVQKYFSAAH
jgi:hypothetical protein